VDDFARDSINSTIRTRERNKSERETERRRRIRCELVTESHPYSRISKEEKRATTRRRTVVVVVERERERERDGQRGGGFCVDDKTRPTSGVPLVLRFFGKDNDVDEEGATSTRISNWKFVVYSESFVRSLSLSQRREILLLFARKGRDADLKITSPFACASSRSSRSTRRGRGASCQAHRATIRTTGRTARPPRRDESDRSRTIFRNKRKNTHHTEKNTGIIGRMGRQMKKTGSTEHLLPLRFPKRTRAKWRGTGCVLLEDKDNRRRLIFKKLNTTRDEGKTPLWGFEVLY